MSQSRPTSGRIEAADIDAARPRWLVASENASKIAASLFQEGSGYGDPDAREADVHRLQSARDEAERLLHEYNDLDRRQIQSEMIHLQRSSDSPPGLRFLSRQWSASQLSSTSWSPCSSKEACIAVHRFRAFLFTFTSRPTSRSGWRSRAENRTGAYLGM